MTTLNESQTPEERAQAITQRNQQATAIIASVRKELQEFFKAQNIEPVRRRIMPLGNYGIYYGDFTYSSTYINVRFNNSDGSVYIDLAGKSSVAEREELATYLTDKLGVKVTVAAGE